MRRIALCLVAFSAAIIGSTVPHVLAEDYVCPPGAKFCPAPGAGQVAMLPPDAGAFGPASPAGDQFAAFRSQLHEGETLIMVAPSVNMQGYPAEVAAAPAPARSPAYAAAPAPGGMPLDFIPPPPGAPRSAPPAPAQTYAREPARTHQSASAPRALAAAPVRRPAPESVRTGGRASAAPATLSRDDPGDPRAAANQAKKPRRADMLSEVANETSRKGSKSGALKSSSRDDREKKSPARKDREKDKKDKTDKKDNKKNKRDKKARTDDDRVPWWKGGFWRNKGK